MSNLKKSEAKNVIIEQGINELKSVIGDLKLTDEHYRLVESLLRWTYSNGFLEGLDSCNNMHSELTNKTLSKKENLLPKCPPKSEIFDAIHNIFNPIKR